MNPWAISEPIRWSEPAGAFDTAVTCVKGNLDPRIWDAQAAVHCGAS